MSFPYRCGRLDQHEPHEWRSRDPRPDRRGRVYHCAGHVITEMQRTMFDTADDAREEREIQDARENPYNN